MLYFKLLLFSSKQNLSKTSRKSFFYVKGLLPSYPTREYIPSTKNRSFFVAEQTICSSPGGNGVHFFGLFLQTQPQGFPPPPSPIREFRRNLMEIV